jgi:hypothetical protein
MGNSIGRIDSDKKLFVARRRFIDAAREENGFSASLIARRKVAETPVADKRRFWPHPEEPKASKAAFLRFVETTTRFPDRTRI